ncbi:MAG: hypothetical protein ACP5NP_17420, partial [Acetobacteraceae bacterium]
VAGGAIANGESAGTSGTLVITGSTFTGNTASSGSGGAIALAAGDRVMMLEHAVYSVISPEGCASILWREATAAAQAAEALRLTAADLLRMRLIDQVVAEPLGGAQRDPEATIAAVGEAIAAALPELLAMDGAARIARREEKFLAMGRAG